ncbi:hypothetical protein NFI96_009725 [Prochilodus magdalenae]|nr:hypothetical protein NFI96_009725 [Prochilodus magdalenae]
MTRRIVYSRDQLLALRKTPPLFTSRLKIPAELRRPYRGCRAGNKRRERKRRYKPCLPSIIMGNVRSLANKTDELSALIRTQREYRECSILCFTESWLNQNVPDSHVHLNGFTTVRADRVYHQTGKKRGGGLAVFVNDRWCNPGHITVKEVICQPDIELCVVGMRPYYLPREFTKVVMCAVYVPPSANADVACDVINSAIARVQNQSPNAFIAVSGDFNHTSLSSCLPTFTQFVKCSTRENRTLDLLYANVKAAYNSKALPPLGRSDHNLVVLTPQYKPLVQRQPASIRSVRKWSPEAVESLQGCFEATQWDVLCDPHNQDIDEVTSCVTDYINFCVDSVVPSKTIRCFANNKPWVTSNLKHLLNQKKRGDKEELKRVQTELRIRIKEAKEEYRTKLETKLENNNTRDVWRGLKDITGFNLSSSGAITDGSYERANELNQFFLRFDNDSPTTTLSSAGSPVVLNLNTSPEQQPPPFTAHTSSIPNIYTSSDSNGPFTTPAQDQSSSSAPTFTADQVKKELKKLKQGKAAGPDGIQPKVLKLCAEQLCGILQHIFNLSCSQGRVPGRWKTSCVVPVPKKKHPVELND